MITFTEKYIYLEDQVTHQTGIHQVDFEKLSNQVFLDLLNDSLQPNHSASALIDICQLIPTLQKESIQSIKIYIPEQDEYRQFEHISKNKFGLPPSYFHLHVIMIKYTTYPSIKKEGEEGLLFAKEVKNRDRLRTLKDILIYVKKWRMLTDSKKVNLQQAATIVGLPKKSLDDYYYHLRIAEQYEFDFMGNLNRTYSYLRKFVRQKIPTRSRPQQPIKKNMKLPNKLNILNFFDEVDPQKQIHKKQIHKQSKENVKEAEDINLHHESSKEHSLSSVSEILGVLGLRGNHVYDENDSFFNQFRFEADINYLNTEI